MPDQPPLAVLIRQRREQKRWSRLELAQRARLSPTTIKNVEGGRHVPTLATLVALAGPLDLPELARLPPPRPSPAQGSPESPEALAAQIRRCRVPVLAQAIRLADVDVGALARALRAEKGVC